MSSADELGVSTASIIMYGMLSALSIRQWLLLRRVPHRSKYVDCKRLFFATLGISALLDIPLWIDCIAYDGPDTCTLRCPSYLVFLSFHYIALCGYAFCLGITTVMWSDILTEHEDRPIIDLKYPDGARKFLYVGLAVYLSLELAFVVSIIGWMDPENPNAFLENNPVHSFNSAFEPLIICIFAGGCLLTGVRLQSYVMSVRLASSLERDFLVQLNFVLFVVTACYLCRAFFVFTLFYDFGSHDIDHVSFTVWILCTRWLPNICNFGCLYIFMSRSKDHSSLSRDLKDQNDSSSLSESVSSSAEPESSHDDSVLEALLLPAGKSTF